MAARSFRRGDRVIVLAHDETHDHGERAGIVADGDPAFGQGYVSVIYGAYAAHAVPLEALRLAEAAPVLLAPPSAQLRRAALLAALALGLVGLALLGGRPARAQEREDASALAFVRMQGEAPVESRSKRIRKPIAIVETGRWVSIPLPPPPAFVRGRLVCAINVNRYLARMGKPTTGSAMALSFLAWGRPSGPKPGAVQVERRGRAGGHVKIVSHHDGGRWLCLNPSASRQRWDLAPCGPRAVAWRAA